MTRDDLALAAALTEMSRLNEDEAYEATARHFVDHLVASVPGCDIAFISVRREDGGFEVVATTGEPPVSQSDPATDGGPLLDVLRYREPRRVEDARDEDRWPLFSARLALRGFRSCLVLPVPAERSPNAAVTLLGREPHLFDDHAYDIILLVTLHAGVAFDNAQLFHDSRRLVENLTTALGTRHTIGLAQGLLMRHFSCDTEGGFTLLRRASQHTNGKLRDIAADLVAAHERGGFREALLHHRIHRDAG
ncbi:GAF and ANTAR domain-containing protein [Saccharothrix xinjiangensis]|uniref:GAF and ANTAR domain-containing protein n=1 Tax=Saccharothrix xinjiangensis TaxID=204798 RepID=A0ABV9XT98_9PSEU